LTVKCIRVAKGVDFMWHTGRWLPMIKIRFTTCLSWN